MLWLKQDNSGMFIIIVNNVKQYHEANFSILRLWSYNLYMVNQNNNFLYFELSPYFSKQQNYPMVGSSNNFHLKWK